jgi:cytochrome c oxidase subunit 2
MWQKNALGLSPWDKFTSLIIPSWGALRFQNSASPLIEQLTLFHDHAITILILITRIVGFNMFSIVNNKLLNKQTIESQPLELFWTIVPAFILIFIGLPSIKLLYLLDEVFHPSITIKTIAHQWFWSYEYTDFLSIDFDAYILPYELGNHRLLETDNHTLIPVNSQVRNLITAADVLHSWAIPSIGVKVDAVPGRLNQINFLPKITGLFYGQCSEICGANHRFMPITLEVVKIKSFIKWVKNFN